MCQPLPATIDFRVSLQNLFKLSKDYSSLKCPRPFLRRGLMVFRAGARESKITPPVGVSMAGYAARKGPAVGVHDDLHVSALVLDDGVRKMAILAADLIAVEKELVSSVRKAISERTGMDVNDILVCASHTHSGPVTSGDKVDREWLNSLQDRIVDITLQAFEKRVEAKLGVGQGRVEGIGANRRDPKRGSVDNSVGIIRVDNAQGKPMAVLMNYACHATVLDFSNRLISADYPGYAKGTVKEALGDETVVMFANGACGDINPGGYSADISAIGGFIPGRTFRKAKKLGAILGKEVLRVVKGIKTHSPVNLSVMTERIHLPLRELPKPLEAEEQVKEKEDLVKLLESQGASGKEITRAKIAAVYAKIELDHARRAALLPQREIEAELQAMVLDDTLLIGLPGEIFVQIGLDIKSGSRFNHTFVIGYASGNIGYVPTEEALREGGYEVTASEFGLEGVEKLEEAALNLVKRMNASRGLG